MNDRLNRDASPLCQISENGVPRERYAISHEVVVRKQQAVVSGFRGAEIMVYGQTSGVPDVWLTVGGEPVQVRFPRFAVLRVTDARIVDDDLIVVIE